MHRAMPSFVVVMAVFIAVASRVEANGGCLMPALAGSMDDRYAGVTECDTVDEFFIDTPGGQRRVRIIRDGHFPDDWSEPFPLIRRGIERAAAALPLVTSAQIDDLVVIASGLLPLEEAPSGDGADDDDWNQGLADSAARGECVMIVFPANTGERGLDFTTAHEFFHCVQFATVFNVMQSDQPNDWWVESSAEWFANLAIPRTGNSDGFVAAFDALSPDHALTHEDGDNRYAYGNSVFFAWFGETRGYAAIADFMRAMPSSGGADAEKTALAGQVSASQFQAFVQAYLDKEITWPGGRAIPLNPRYGASIIWVEDNQIEETEADQLVLHRTELVFTCGTWKIELSAEQGEWAVSQEPGEWGSLPATIKVPVSQERRYRLGAMGSGGDGFHVTIAATREDQEGGCLCNEPTEETIARLDQCLVGRWELVEGGMNEWLDRQINTINQASGDFDHYESKTAASNRILTIRRDGLFEYRSVPYTRSERAVRDGEVTTSYVEAYQAGSGTWSTRGDRLRACVMGNSSSANADIESSDGGTLQIDLTRGYMGDHITSGSYAYSCSKTELVLQILGIVMLPEPMVWKYQRR